MTKKRLIKLLMGDFGLPRRVATQKAILANQNHIPYEEVYYYFFKCRRYINFEALRYGK